MMDDRVSNATDDGSASGLTIVGIGASAGGLRPLQLLFDGMPANTGCAFVVVQHLSPDFDSLMKGLLSPYTEMPVERVVDGVELQRNAVYLIPPGKEMIVAAGRFILKDREVGQSLPVDRFFFSLAQEAGNRAVAVVMSGTGSDGSRGVRAVHEAGGLVIAQDPNTAEFDGMPRSIIETGLVDLILAPENMGEAVARAVSRVEEAEPSGPPCAPDLSQSPYSQVIQLLQQRFTVDFNAYKPNMINRRIERRMIFSRFDNVLNYRDFLERNPDELKRLHKDLLIGVTRFFRDPQAFARIETDVLPNLLEETPLDRQVRVWVPACATGEEAYTLGILLHETARRLGRPLNAKIFATDIDRQSIALAMEGLYSPESLLGVSTGRLNQYFQREGERYRLLPEIRHLVLFSDHDLLRDPPFRSIDLLSCRNLLIYFQSDSQQKVLALFHFAIRRGGALFLGPSESLINQDEDFDVIDRRWRIYRKRGGEGPIHHRPSRPPSIVMDPRIVPSRSQERWRGRDPESWALHELLLERFMPPGVLIDSHLTVIHIYGAGAEYLKLQPGRATADALAMVGDDLRIALNSALQRARREGGPVVYGPVRATRQEQPCRIRLTVEPVVDRKLSVPYYVAIFEPMENAVVAQAEPEDEFDLGREARLRITDLESEIAFTRESLQATVEELATSNEELQATNQELMAANEELHSTNEELHSVNEELYTVNAEYQQKIEELRTVTSDMEHLFRSTDIGTVFVDRQMRIKKFTPAISTVFNIVSSDIGRSLGHFSSSLGDDRFFSEIKGVLSGGDSVEREVDTDTGRILFMRILPYRPDPKSIDGAVITFIDVSLLKQAQRGTALLREVVEKSNDGIFLIRPDDGRIIDANGAAARSLGQTREQLLSLTMGEIGLQVPNPRSWFPSGTPDPEQPLTTTIEGRQRRRDGSSFPVELSASLIMVEGTAFIVAIARDVTERLRQERALARSRRFAEVVIESIGDGILGVDPDGRIISANPGVCRMLGQTLDGLLGQSLASLLHPAWHRDTDRIAAGRTFVGDTAGQPETRMLRRRDGTGLPVLLSTHALTEHDQPIGSVAVIRDLSALRETVGELLGTVSEGTDLLG